MANRVVCTFLAFCLLLSLCGCADLPDDSQSDSSSEPTPAPTLEVTLTPEPILTEPASASSSEPDASSESTNAPDVAAPTGTVKPTSTVMPTFTIKPTATANPTSTVKPTSTKKPTATKKPTTAPKATVAALDTVISGAPAVSNVLKTVASGTVVYKGGTSAEPVTIDASNINNGYVMIRAASTVRLKVIIIGPSTVKYTYNLRGDNAWEVFQFSDGGGTYKITVYREVTSGKYAALASESVNVSLKDPNAPFLHPNQYVNFTDESLAVLHVAKICTEKMTDIERIETIYHYVITNFSYDYQKAASVKSGYIPDIDAVFKAKKGICFDYASLMAAMLRAYGIPTKLVIGYTGDEYHAWISTYTKESGWVEGAIFFNGKDWKLMDPTFASSANSSQEIMNYIAKTSNYTAKYIY